MLYTRYMLCILSSMFHLQELEVECEDCEVVVLGELSQWHNMDSPHFGLE